ncbi:MAG: cytochrome C oxidase subunit IV family protein [Leptospirales bacterium]
MSNEQDYHGHPNYNVIGIVLVVLMALSVVVDFVVTGNKLLSVTLIFGFSTIKAYLVIANFMHLKYEPKLVDLFPYLSIACMIIFFAGVYPDSANIHQILSVNFTALDPAVDFVNLYEILEGTVK